MKKILVFVMFALAMSGCGMEQVDEGSRGIKTKWGKVEGEALLPGLYFYNPISSDIFELDVREQKLEGETSAFTSDTQNVVVSYAVTYYPKQDRIHEIYSQFGRGWDKTIVPQVVLGSVKDVIGSVKADDLVAKREEARTKAERELKENLADRNVILTKLDFTNLNFDDGYEKAVEEKVIAIQRAAEAKNRTVQVEEEAKQVITSAKAAAESMKIKTEALSKSKSLVDYEAIQKWNGELPQFMFGSGTMPMINLDNLTKGKRE